MVLNINKKKKFVNVIRKIRLTSEILKKSLLFSDPIITDTLLRKCNSTERRRNSDTIKAGRKVNGDGVC